MSKNVFGNVFGKHLLIEQDQLNISDEEAMGMALDPNTDPNDFNVDAGESDVALATLAKAEQRKIDRLKDWISKFAEFADFLNGTDDQSVQSQLKNATPESVFGKIAKGEAKSITRAAIELSSLAESLKGYLATSTNPITLRDHQ